MQKVSYRIYSFDDFALDLARCCLQRGKEEVRLRPKPFEVLKYLVENRGRLVGKDELMQAIWTESFVTDDSLVQCMVEVRRALGDDSQRYIKTVSRRGYIFDAQVVIEQARERGSGSGEERESGGAGEGGSGRARESESGRVEEGASGELGEGERNPRWSTVSGPPTLPVSRSPALPLFLWLEALATEPEDLCSRHSHYFWDCPLSLCSLGIPFSRKKIDCCAPLQESYGG